MTAQYWFRLRRPPFASLPIRADTRPFPLHTGEDFALYRALAEPNDAPILVSPRQIYPLLTAVLECIAVAMPGSRMTVLQANMPGGLRLPQRLLAADIFLSQDVEPLFQALVARGIPSVAIAHGMRRFPIEAGRNEIRIAMAPAPTPAAVDMLERGLQPLGIDPAPDHAAR